ncbi:hypothetical protein TRFO_34298 [Tritrichomonas foetus]|uniref:Uncharacterized protein n=1 Tax=Tritrichomonas foetus TaxID=1144522 RepID=A0A1J4JJG9_9EUKA|nr:hypothetical protein TRFO_34298 [Tritrichomonas foetus]|eukprot:OHS99296.1 hypothetical protein TRFO_34298 [Tritrichomonas foetus]
MATPFKVCLLGASGAGKTALTLRLTRSSFERTYVPTLQERFLHRIVIDNNFFNIEIIDTSGQFDDENSYNLFHYQKNYYLTKMNINKSEINDQKKTVADYSSSERIDDLKGSSVFKFNLDACNELNTEDIEKMTESAIKVSNAFVIVYDVKSQASFEQVKNIKCLIEKVTLNPNPHIILVANKVEDPKDRVISTEQGISMAELLGQAPYFETSAKLGSNVKTVFEEAAKMAILSEFKKEIHANGCCLLI